MLANQEDPLLLKISRRAMATDFELLMHRDAEARQVDEAVKAIDWLETIEAELTVYSPHSTISRINQAKAGVSIRVSAMVFDVLCHAQRLAELLEGAFDVTAGPLVEAWGFTSRSGKRPTPLEISVALQNVGWNLLQLESSSQTVCKQKDGVCINLGAIGKGYALDIIAARLASAGVENFLLHGGNSSILARGHSDRSTADGWLVGLMHPVRSGTRLCGIRLLDQALATSGSGKQFFHLGGKRYGHVIDPRTGSPAGDSLSVTVVVDKATSADAAATGLYVLGVDWIDPFTKANPSFQVIATVAGKRQNEIELLTYNYRGELIRSDA